MRQMGFTHETNSYATPVEWYTPLWIFETFTALGIQFDLDPASPGRAAVPWIPIEDHLTPAEDGLARKWFGKVWLNPPYGPGLEQWVSKFIEHGNGVLLAFARTDTRWFQRLAPKCGAVCFLRGRLSFVPSRPDGIAKSGAGAGSALFAMGEECSVAVGRWESSGWVVLQGDTRERIQSRIQGA